MGGESVIGLMILAIKIKASWNVQYGHGAGGCYEGARISHWIMLITNKNNKNTYLYG